MVSKVAVTRPDAIAGPDGRRVIVILQTTGGVTKSGAMGGGVAHFVRLARYWTAQGEHVFYVTNQFDSSNREYRGVGTVRGLPTLGILDFSRPETFLLELLANHLVQHSALDSLLDEIRQQNRQIVILSTSPYPSDAIAAFRLKRRSHAQTVVYFHHIAPPPWWFAWRRGSMARTVASSLMWTLAFVLVKIGDLDIGLDNPSTLESTGWKVRGRVLRDEDFLSEPPPKEERGIASRSIDACFVGRVTPNKGVFDLLSAWRSVVDTRRGASLVICGQIDSAKVNRRIHAMVARLHLEDNVTLVGFVPDAEKRRILSESRLLVFPSYEEGWSLAVMEAAAYGTIPVTYNLLAYSYLGNSCVRVPVGNTKALASAITELLSDPKRMESLSTSARESVRPYSVERTGHYILETLRGPTAPSAK